MSTIAEQVAAALAAVDWTSNDDELPTTEAAKTKAAEVATAILETGALLGFTLPMPEFSANGIGGVDLEWIEVNGALLVAVHGAGAGEVRYFAYREGQRIKGVCEGAGIALVAAWIAREVTP
jgi:hypothetical protein